MNALRISGCIVLMVIAVWVCVRYRRVFVIQRGATLRSSMVTLCKSLLCVALLAGASWAGYYAVTISRGWWRNALYTFLPIIVLSMWVYPFFMLKDLPKEWKRSPLFILALLPPVVGFAVMFGVWWCEVGRQRYSELKTQP